MPEKGWPSAVCPIGSLACCTTTQLQSQRLLSSSQLNFNSTQLNSASEASAPAARQRTSQQQQQQQCLSSLFTSLSSALRPSFPSSRQTMPTPIATPPYARDAPNTSSQTLLFTDSLLWRTDFFSPTSYPVKRGGGLYDTRGFCYTPLAGRQDGTAVKQAGGGRAGEFRSSWCRIALRRTRTTRSPL